MNSQTNNILDGAQVSDSVQIFKALGDETRIRMLGLLRHGELCVCDIMEVLQLPQSTASRHLAYLRNSNWVTAMRRGKWMYYTLSITDHNEMICSCIMNYLSSFPQLETDYEKMARHLEEKADPACH